MTPHSHTKPSLSQIFLTPRDQGSRHLAPEATMGLPDTPPNKMKTSWAVLVCEETHIRLARVATKSL